MNKIKSFFLSLSAAIFFAVVLSSNSVGALTVLPSDASSPRSGCTFLGLEGEYITQIQESIDQINKIRLEACKEGIENPATGNALTMDDYVPIKWSSDLEYIARLRAAEASLTMDHARTNGQSIWFKSPNGISSRGEVIAWNWSKTMTMGIDQWYGEKADWVNNTGGVTGHYTAMINPNNRYVGMGTFVSELTQYPNTTVGEFCGSSYGEIDSSRGSSTGKIIQTVEVTNSNISYSLSGTDTLSVSASVTFTDYWSSSLTTDGLILVGESAANVKWSSSNTSVATVSNSGKITRVGCGSADIIASLPGGATMKKSVNYNHDFQTTTTPATCKDEGKTVKKCKYCGHTETQVIPKTNDHKYETTTVPATCKDEGKLIKKCKVCGHSETQVIPKTDDHKYEITTVTATCTQEGKYEKKCSVCGYTVTRIIPKKEHSFGDWVTVKPPTEEADGVEERICSVCNASETRVVKYTGEHSTETDDNEGDPPDITTDAEETSETEETTAITGNSDTTSSDTVTSVEDLTEPEPDNPADESAVGTPDSTDMTVETDNSNVPKGIIPIVISTVVGAGCIALIVALVRKFKIKK